MPINKISIEVIFENKKPEKDRRIITKKANLKTFTSSIFFPSHINVKLLHKAKTLRYQYRQFFFQPKLIESY